MTKNLWYGDASEFNWIQSSNSLLDSVWIIHDSNVHIQIFKLENLKKLITNEIGMFGIKN